MNVMLLDLLDASTARQVLALQRMAYRIEADLIGFDDIPPLQESLDELQACKEVFSSGPCFATLACGRTGPSRGQRLSRGHRQPESSCEKTL